MRNPFVEKERSWRRFLLVAVAVLSSASVLFIVGQKLRDPAQQVRARRVANEKTKLFELGAGGDLQGAINAAQCGDSIVLQSGATWDGSFTLPGKGCSAGSPIAIRSSAGAALPLGRVGPADVSNMPRIRSLGGGNYGAAFQTAANAGWWVLDGLEITDNAARTATISMLLDFSNSSTHDITVQRCYIHQKETGTNYNRSVQRAIQFE